MAVVLLEFAISAESITETELAIVNFGALVFVAETTISLSRYVLTESALELSCADISPTHQKTRKTIVVNFIEVTPIKIKRL